MPLRTVHIKNGASGRKLRFAEQVRPYGPGKGKGAFQSGWDRVAGKISGGYQGPACRSFQPGIDLSGIYLHFPDLMGKNMAGIPAKHRFRKGETQFFAQIGRGQRKGGFPKRENPESPEQGFRAPAEQET